MRELNRKVYQKPEEYKIGWLHGFSDCQSHQDIVLRQRQRSLAIQETNLSTREAARLYDDGYFDGMRARDYYAGNAAGKRAGKHLTESSACIDWGNSRTDLMTSVPEP